MTPSRGGLEIEIKPSFERRFWQAQRIGWWCVALLLAAGVGGLWGPSLLGPTQVEKTFAKVTYERFLHRHAPAELVVQILPAMSPGTKTQLALNRSYIDSMENLHIVPGPEKEESVGDSVIYTFERSAPGKTMKVVFSFEPRTFGKIPLTITLNDHPPVVASQFIYP